MHTTTVGLLHPGRMGASIGAALRPLVADVLWAEQGRSDETAKRAEWADLTAVPTVGDVARRSDIVISVCPPAAAVDVAAQVAAVDVAAQVAAVDVAANHSGCLYLDANAVAPATVERIAELIGFDRVVDGALIGPPAWQPGTTVLHLSGPRAAEVEELFVGTPLDTRVVGPRVGQASAVKACFAAQSKAVPTIWAVIAAAAEAYDVGPAVREELARDGIDLVGNLDRLASGATSKAWRWDAEMDEAAVAFGGIGLPDGFSRSAAEVYRRVAAVVDRDSEPDAQAWLSALLPPH
ncbi:MAG: DUF1932 domain-containing protein [Nocardioidaceae bacterium]